MVSTSNPKYLGDASVDNTRWKGKGLVSFCDGSVRSYSRPQLAAQGSDLQVQDTGIIWDLDPTK